MYSYHLNDNLCRVCLQNNGLLSWNDKVFKFSSMSYKDCYFRYSKLKESDSDSFPTSLCNICAEDLKNAHMFFEKALESYRILQVSFTHRTQKTDVENFIEANNNYDESHSIGTPNDNCTMDAKTMMEIEDGMFLPNAYNNESLAETKYGINKKISIEEKVPDETEHIQIPFRNLLDQQLNRNCDREMVKYHSTIKNGKKRNIYKTSEITLKEQQHSESYDTELQQQTPEILEQNMSESYGTKSLFKSTKQASESVLLIEGNSKRRECEAENSEDGKYIETCSQCGIKLYSKVSLKNHMQIHEENPQKNYKCEFCKKSFLSRGGRNMHRRIHTGRMVKCPICCREFYRQIDLNRHMPKHSAAPLQKNCVKANIYSDKRLTEVAQEICLISTYDNETAKITEIGANHTMFVNNQDNIVDDEHFIDIQYNDGNLIKEKNNEIFDITTFPIPLSTGSTDKIRERCQNMDQELSDMNDKNSSTPATNSKSGKKRKALKVNGSTQLNRNEALHAENPQKNYKCEFCKKSFLSRGGRNMHRRIHTGQMVKCPICCREFYRQIDLKRHMPKHSAAPLQKNCVKANIYSDKRLTEVEQEICPISTYTNETAAITGIVANHTMFANKQDNTIDDENFIDAQNYDGNLITEKNEIYDTTNLPILLTIETSGKIRETCDSSAETLMDQEASDIKVINSSTPATNSKSGKKRKPNLLICAFCSLKVNGTAQLKRHEATHSANRQRTESCPQCGLKLYTKRALNDHMKTHDENRQKRHKCEFCEKAFFNRGALNVHRRIHLGLMVKCPFCSKEFCRQIDLDKHLLRHSVSPLQRNFEKLKYTVQCHDCNKYVPTSKWKAHKAAHLNQPQLKCKICDKDFFSRRKCVSHLHQFHKKNQKYDEFIHHYGNPNTRLNHLMIKQQAVVKSSIAEINL